MPKKVKTTNDLVAETLAICEQDAEYCAARSSADLGYAIASGSVFKPEPLYENGFSVIGYVDYGECEGIDGTVMLRGTWNSGPNWMDCPESPMNVFTFHTIRVDKDAYFAVGKLVSMFCYYANQVVKAWAGNGKIE